MEEQTGAIVARTIEERIEELEFAQRRTEQIQRRDDNLIKTAAGQLRKAKDARTLEDIKHVLVEVAGQLDAVGRE